MVILDVSVVNVALPSIRNDLGFSATDLQWVVNAYTLTFAGFLLLGGRAADLLGRRRVFVAGLLLFAARLAGRRPVPEPGHADRRARGSRASAARSSRRRRCRSSPRPSPRAPSATARSAPGARWARAGGAAGALLGGILTDLLGWQWILFINVPIGVVAALAAPPLHRRGRAHRGRRAPLRPRRRAHRHRRADRPHLRRSCAPTCNGWGSAATLGDAGGRPRAARRLPPHRGPASPRGRSCRCGSSASRTLTGANLVVFFARRRDLRHVVLRLALPAAGARLLADRGRPRVPADDARDHRRLDDRLARRCRPRRRRAACWPSA